MANNMCDRTSKRLSYSEASDTQKPRKTILFWASDARNN